MKRVVVADIIFFLLVAIYFIYANFDNYVTLNLLDLSGKGFTSVMRLSTYSVIMLLCGIMAGAGTVYIFLSLQKEKTKAYKRELEKTSVLGSENASKVDVLEAKIKTLEKAFDTVIDERKQMELKIENLNIELEKFKS